MEQISNERLAEVLRVASDDEASHDPSGLHYVTAALKKRSTLGVHDQIVAPIRILHGSSSDPYHLVENLDGGLWVDPVYLSEVSDQEIATDLPPAFEPR